jgi:hypothetical protein
MVSGLRHVREGIDGAIEEAIKFAGSEFVAGENDGELQADGDGVVLDGVENVRHSGGGGTDGFASEEVEIEVGPGGGEGGEGRHGVGEEGRIVGHTHENGKRAERLVAVAFEAEGTRLAADLERALLVNAP